MHDVVIFRDGFEYETPNGLATVTSIECVAVKAWRRENQTVTFSNGLEVQYDPAWGYKEGGYRCVPTNVGKPFERVEKVLALQVRGGQKFNSIGGIIESKEGYGRYDGNGIPSDANTDDTPKTEICTYQKSIDYLGNFHITRIG